VLICGTIDRVDLDGTGQRALVLDYKLGKPPDYAAVQSGSSLQMPLYLLAMERIFRKVGAAACYDSAREAGRPRLFRSEHCAPQQFRPDSPRETGDTVKPLNREQYALLIRNAEATAVQVARRIASAGIEAHPGEHCRACSFRDVCRTTLLGGHDGEPLSLTSSPPASMTGELHVPG
jgi:RecB family exonuclease